MIFFVFCDLLQTCLRDVLTDKVTDEAESLLSPWGKASFNLLVDQNGSWNGSSGSMFTPWADNNRYLTWTQQGFSQQDDRLVALAVPVHPSGARVERSGGIFDA